MITGIKTVEELEETLVNIKQSLKDRTVTGIVEVLKMSRTANRSYYEKEVPKKSGAIRLIYAPSKRLKLHQKLISTGIAAIYSCPSHVYGFTGKGSIDNAKRHVGCDYVITVDIKDFFPSIKVDMLRALFVNIGCSPEVSQVLAKLCCKDGALVQGSPASPILANMICERLDNDIVDKFSKNDWHNINGKYIEVENQFTFSRYVDDIAVSIKRHRPEMWEGHKFDHRPLLVEIVDYLTETIRKHGFKLNHKKVKIQHRGMRQSVNGLTVNHKVNVNRQWIRNLKAQIHNVGKFKALSNFEYEQIQGKISYIAQVKGVADPTYQKFRALFEKALR